MKTFSTLFIFLFALATAIVNAQDATTTSALGVRPFQMSFVTPMGTNGLQSHNFANNFSLNIFAGYSAGVQGVEFAGFYNLSRGKVSGLQLSGFGNTNTDDVKGCQITGFSNTVKGDVNGAQLAGFTNIVKGKVEAVQISGFFNLASDSLVGGQLAGFANSSGSVGGGVQLSGFANVVHGDAKSAQIAGFTNVNTGDIRGLQISGFVNYAKNVKGLQLGFINYSDSLKGAAVGFLSIVKHGYRSVEISGNESLYGTVSFKTGTNQFYNILSVGTSINNNNLKWGWGYGLGTMMNVTDDINVNFDVVAYHINEDSWWTNRLNMLNKVNLCVSYKLMDRISVFGGATWNIYLSHIYNDEMDVIDASMVKWSSYDKTINMTNVKMYPGFSAGIRLQ